MGIAGPDFRIGPVLTGTPRLRRGWVRFFQAAGGLTLPSGGWRPRSVGMAADLRTSTSGEGWGVGCVSGGWLCWVGRVGGLAVPGWPGLEVWTAASTSTTASPQDVGRLSRVGPGWSGGWVGRLVGWVGWLLGRLASQPVARLPARLPTSAQPRRDGDLDAISTRRPSASRRDFLLLLLSLRQGQSYGAVDAGWLATYCHPPPLQQGWRENSFCCPPVP